MKQIPGLIDLQVNGNKGINFSSESLTTEDTVAVCRSVLEAGTSAFLPTVITSPGHIYERNLPIISAVLERDEFQGRVLGLHIEGPFISPLDGARGGHSAEWVIKPNIEYLDKLIELAGGKIKLITIAAEIEGAEQLARHAVSRGICVALGHQMADVEDLKKLAEAGATALTHLGNGIPTMLERHNNPVWAGLAEDKLSATIITDGHHLPATVIKAFILAKGVSRCIVVSDASHLAGLAPGNYECGSERVILEEGGRLYNPRTGYLFGSSFTILKCMNYLASLGLLSVDEMVEVGFYNPLGLIGVEPDSIRPKFSICFDEEKHTFSVVA